MSAQQPDSVSICNFLGSQMCVDKNYELILLTKMVMWQEAEATVLSQFCCIVIMTSGMDNDPSLTTEQGLVPTDKCLVLNRSFLSNEFARKISF